jgi:hypothetical protein
MLRRVFWHQQRRKLSARAELHLSGRRSDGMEVSTGALKDFRIIVDYELDLL